MADSSEGAGRNPQQGTSETGTVALWRTRAEQQARRADQLATVLEKIAEELQTVNSHAFEVANDDRGICEDCGRRGWPEDGFHSVDDEEVGRLDFCSEHWEVTP